MAKSSQSNSQEVIVTIDDFRTLARKTKGELLPPTVGFEAQNIRFTEEYGSFEKRKSRSLYANGLMVSLGTLRIPFIDRFYRNALEIYTKSLMHFDGNNGSGIILDESGKSISNNGVVLDLMEYGTDSAAQGAYVGEVDYATGGTITTVGSDKIHTFTANDNFVFPGIGTVRVLVIGGGGGIDSRGANFSHSGAGKYMHELSHAVTAQTYAIVVGAAGSVGNTGGTSSFDDILAIGGNSSSTTDGGGTSGNGYILGNLSGGPYGASSGGGGGSSGNGGNAYNSGDNTVAGTAGVGTANDISGTSFIYACGGCGGQGGGGNWHDGVPGSRIAGDGASGTPELAPQNGIVVIRYTPQVYNFQCYSEGVIIKEGSYSLKCIAKITDSLNKTLTRTIASPIDLTGIDLVRFNMYASRTGANIKISIHDSGGTTTTITPTISSANHWQIIEWDLSAVSDANKNAIDSIIITVVNADVANTFYIDNMIGGQVVIDTTTKKFGTGSALFVKGSYMSIADNNDWHFGTGDFTIDMQVSFTSLTNAMILCGQYEDTDHYWYIKKDTNANNNKLSIVFKDSTVKGSYVMTNAWSGVTTDTFYHLEFSRSGIIGLLFIDGTSQTLTETTAFSTNDVGIVIGDLIIGQQNGTNFFKGNIDEFRISKGTVRHTTNFTAPTLAYANTANTKYLFATYEDTFKVGNDTTGDFTTLKSGLDIGARWNGLTYKSRWYSCNGINNNICCDGLNVENIGISIPTTPAIAYGASTGLTGIYSYKVTYEIDGYQEGSSSTASDPLTPSNQDIVVTIPVSANTRCSGRNIYRTLDGGTIYYFLTRITNNTTTTYTDNNADTVLDTTIPVPFDNDPPPIFKYMTLHQSRIFGARVIDNISRVVYSDIKNGMSLPDVYPADNFFDLIKDNGEDVTACLEDQYGQLIVMKPSAVVKIDTSTDDPIGWSGFGNILSINGCIAPYTAVKTPVGIIYLTRYAEGKKALMVWNGSATQPISAELEPILSAISEDRVIDMIAKYHNGSYYLSYSDPTDGNSYNDRVIVMDLTTGSWIIDKKNVDCFSSWTSGIVGVVGADKGELYTSSSDTEGLIHHEDTLDAPLSESTIEMYYLSQWIDFGWLGATLKRVRKQLFQVRIDFERSVASGNLLFDYFLDNSSVLNSKTFDFTTYAAKGFIIYQFPIATYCKNIRFGILHNDDIYALKIKAVHFSLSPEPLSEFF